MQKKILIEKQNFILAVENHKKSNLENAESIYKKIIRSNPNHIESIFLLGSLSVQMKNYKQAVHYLNKTIKIQPENSNAHHNLGVTYFELKEFKKAMFCSENAIKINPNHIEALNNIGNIYQELREFNKAKNIYQRIIQINPNHTKSLNSLGNIFKEIGNFKSAVAFYKKTIQIKPEHAKAYYNLGLLFKILGNFKEAEIAYKNSLKYDSNNLIAFYDLSGLNKKILNLNLKNKIIKIIDNKSSSKKNISYGNFLLSKLELKKKNYKEEFNLLLKAHSLYFESEQKKFKKANNYWLNELPKSNGLNVLNNYKINNEKKIKPIFIVGVPRCGSTLIEKIIASGSKLIPIGEETGILSLVIGKKIYKKQLSNLNIDILQKQILEKYEQKKLIQEKNNYIFTDKSLDNFFYISLIKKIFPDSKIINCKRNILHSIMSILKTNLREVSWAHKLDDIFKYFDIYLKKINYFKKNFPGFIYELELERFINNPEAESKKLMNFCNLPWSIKCLEFYKRKDLTSQTASNVQIRKPINKKKSGEYLPYKKFFKKYEKKYDWFV